MYPTNLARAQYHILEVCGTTVQAVGLGLQSYSNVVTQQLPIRPNDFHSYCQSLNQTIKEKSLGSSKDMPLALNALHNNQDNSTRKLWPAYRFSLGGLVGPWAPNAWETTRPKLAACWMRRYQMCRDEIAAKAGQAYYPKPRKGNGRVVEDERDIKYWLFYAHEFTLEYHAAESRSRTPHASVWIQFCGACYIG